MNAGFEYYDCSELLCEPVKAAPKGQEERRDEQVRGQL